MKPFEEVVELRLHNIEGFTDWLWPREDGVEGDGGAWLGPMNDWNDSHSTKYFEYVTEYGTVIQAGGNCGMYPRLFSKYFKEVYSFEPDPLNFYCAVNNCKNLPIKIFPCALGSSHRNASLIKAPPSNIGMHKILDEGYGKIPILKIDDFKYHHPVGLIQLDVEGFEWNVLNGATETIEKYSPVIICEKPSRDCIKFLNNLGYTERSISMMDHIFVKEVV